MLCKDSNDVIKIVKERNVSFIQFWFTDVLGILKSFSITPSELEEALSEGMGFDRSEERRVGKVCRSWGSGLTAEKHRITCA